MRRATFGLKACVQCKYLVEEKVNTCPVCGSTKFSREWIGMIIIYKPENSKLAEMLNIKKPGKYAIKVI